MNARIVLLLTVAANIAFPLAAAGADRALKDRLEKYVAEVQANLKSGDEKFALMAVEVDEKGEELVRSRETDLLTPASVLKILTTYAALKTLGAEYRFPTEIFVDSLPSEKDVSLDTSLGMDPKRQAGWKAGNLYVRGYGDPTMVDERLWELARSVSRRGVKKIDNIVIDDSLFVDPPSATGPDPYQAGLSAVSLDHNCYAVHVAASGPTLPAFVELTQGAPFQLVNRVKSLRTGDQSVVVTQSISSSGYVPALNQSKSGRYRILKFPEMTVTVQGHLNVKTPIQSEYRTVPYPPSFFGSVLQHFLREQGVEVSGQLMFGETPGGTQLLVGGESWPLGKILIDLNHYSSNFVAGQIVFALGQDSTGRFRQELGLKKIAATLEDAGFQPGTFRIVDGSGLERGNLLSVKQLVNVLVRIYRDFSAAPDFISSLSRYGRSGTLKNRKALDQRSVDTSLRRDLPNLKLRAESVWGKTGTLDGVSSLAGYLELESGKRAAFAVISNGVEKNRATEIEDRFVRLLIGAQKEQE